LPETSVSAISGSLLNVISFSCIL
jgi:hypothetical protein